VAYLTQENYTADTLVVSNAYVESVTTNGLTIGGPDRVVRIDYGKFRLDPNPNQPENSFQNPIYKTKKSGLTVVADTTGHFKLSVLSNSSETSKKVFISCAAYHQGDTHFDINSGVDRRFLEFWYRI
jgi:hypothetical protein